MPRSKAKLKAYYAILCDALEREITEEHNGTVKELTRDCAQLEDRIKRAPNGDTSLAVAKARLLNETTE